MKFTDYLLEKYAEPLRQSTSVPFLRAAGDGTLSKEVFVGWLRQDYLYAHMGYTKFASIFLAKLPCPTSVHPKTEREKNLLKAKDVIINSLGNIKAEVELFLSISDEHSLDLFVDGQLPDVVAASATTSSSTTKSSAFDGDRGLLGVYEDNTKSYIDYMVALAATGGVEEGLCLLWIMEKCYLEAWTYASSQANASGATDTEPHQKAMTKLRTNWSGEGMKGFIEVCEEVFEGMGVEVGSDVAQRCEDVVKRVIYLEKGFWPVV